MIENIEWNRDIKNFIRPNCLGLEWVEVNSLTCLHLLSQWHPATWIQLSATAIYCANFCRQANSNFSVAPVIIAIIYNCNLQKLLRIFFDWTVIFYKMFILRLHQLIDIYRIQNCIFKRPIIQEVNIYCLTTNNFQCYITPCS